MTVAETKFLSKRFISLGFQKITRIHGYVIGVLMMRKLNKEENPKLLKCPKCGCLLIRVNEEKEGQRVDCEWMCISPTCRKGLVFDTYYGYIQKDVNQNSELSDYLNYAPREGV